MTRKNKGRLGQGAHTLQAVGVDGDLSSYPSVAVRVHVVTSEVAAPTIDYPGEAARIAGDAFTISGQGGSGVQVVIELDGQQAATATVDKAGHYAYAFTQQRAGSHAVRASAVDFAGRASAFVGPVTFELVQASEQDPIVGERGRMHVSRFVVDPAFWDPDQDPPLQVQATIVDTSVRRRIFGLQRAVMIFDIRDRTAGNILDLLSDNRGFGRNLRPARAELDLQGSFAGPVPLSTETLTLDGVMGIGYRCPFGDWICNRVFDTVVDRDGEILILADRIELQVDVDVGRYIDLEVERVCEPCVREASENPVFARNPPSRGLMKLFPVHHLGGSAEIFDLYDSQTYAGYVGCLRERFGCTDEHSCAALGFRESCAQKREPAWVLELVGEDLDKIQGVFAHTFDGQAMTRPLGHPHPDLVHQETTPVHQALGLAPYRDPDIDGSGVESGVHARILDPAVALGLEGVDAHSTAYIAFAVEEAAEPGPREIHISYSDGRHQRLREVGLYVARHGRAKARYALYLDHYKGLGPLIERPKSVQGGKDEKFLEFSPRAELTFEGWPVGDPAVYDALPQLNAQDVGCMWPAAGHTIQAVVDDQHPPETAFKLTGRFHYRQYYTFAERDEQGRPVMSQDDPFDRCRTVIYDGNLKAAIAAYGDVTEISPELFNFLKDPMGKGDAILIGPSVESLVARPGILGDSMTQGFYGGVVKPESQRWSFSTRLIDEMVSSVDPAFVNQHHYYYSNYFWQGPDLASAIC